MGVFKSKMLKFVFCRFFQPIQHFRARFGCFTLKSGFSRKLTGSSIDHWAAQGKFGKKPNCWLSSFLGTGYCFWATKNEKASSYSSPQPLRQAVSDAKFWPPNWVRAGMLRKGFSDTAVQLSPPPSSFAFHPPFIFLVLLGIDYGQAFISKEKKWGGAGGI